MTKDVRTWLFKKQTKSENAIVQGLHKLKSDEEA